MKPFHTIAVPHKDILEGRLTMDVFAADLWHVFCNRGPEEYKDADTFFKKTFVTKGLDNLFKIVEKRIRGKGGDSVIQLQTPFGGGKTHALIGLYHKAKEWKASPFVFIGDKLSPADTLIWEELERQLTGKVKDLKGKTVPSGEKIRQLLESKQPVILLIDELVEYLIPARGIIVGGSTLDSQVLSFVKRLSEAVSSLDKCVLLSTSPSRTQYSQEDQHLLNLLSERLGRIERAYTPVEDWEISSIIRRRLFSELDENGAKKTVLQYIEYAEKEDILPIGSERSEYRQRFIGSYPFSPEVVDVLYQRWGSYPNFQRTRGVLRLLALVIYSLKNSGRPYITLADFDLNNEELRPELVKNIGSEFDSVIAADITNPDSGAKKVDGVLGRSFQGLMLGTRVATSIFLYSFSGGQEKGAHLGDIKRSATTMENPSSVVVEAVEQLKSKLFYLQSQNEKYFFLNQPNMNRVLITKMENIKDREVMESEKEILEHQIQGGKLKVFLWPNRPKDIPDTEELKLVILPEKNDVFIRNLLETKGDSPRVYRNTIFFLCPSETEKSAFRNLIKRRMAYLQIQSDATLKLSDEQKREIAANLRREEDNLKDAVKRCYRLAFAPGKDGIEEIDLGIPTYGEKRGLDQEVYEQLKAEQKVLEKIAALVLKEKYLRDKEFVKVRLIHDSMLKTPGERRVTSPLAVREAISQGVKLGLFGLGELSIDEATVTCRYFKEDATPEFGETEVIVKDTVCVLQKQAGEAEPIPFPVGKVEGADATTSAAPISRGSNRALSSVTLEFEVPRGKVSQLMGMMSFLQSKFQELHISVKATEGSISEEDYLNKIKETLKQLGISFQE